MENDSQKAFRSWAKLLNPEELRSNLVRASIYLTAYEFLHQALIEHLENFFCDGFDANGPILGESYRSKVLSLHEVPFFASSVCVLCVAILREKGVDRASAVASVPGSERPSA